MKKALIKEYAKMFTEKVAVIHPAFDEKPTTVAFVEVAKELSDEEKCEVAFKKTNTIDKAWWENEGVTKMFGGDLHEIYKALEKMGKGEDFIRHIG